LRAVWAGEAALEDPHLSCARALHLEELQPCRMFSTEGEWDDRELDFSDLLDMDLLEAAMGTKEVIPLWSSSS